MKKIQVLLLPCFLFIVCLFFGCNNVGDITETDNQIYPTLCKFSDNSLVELSTNDKNKTAVVKLEIVGDSITVQPTISYNENIISYNIETGEIVAKQVGTTNIVALYQTSKNNIRQAILPVSVTETNFAHSIYVEDSYSFKLTTPAVSAKINPIVYTSELNDLGYSLGLTFESLTPEIFTVDNEGFVLPCSLGTGLLKITAISGYNEVTDTYTYMSVTTSIVVEAPVSVFELSVVDKNLNPIQYDITDDNMLVYNLYYGKKFGETTENFYYFKITCDKILSKCVISKFCETFNTVNTNSVIHKILPGGESSDGGKIIYIPFNVCDSGSENIYFVNYDVALNYAKNLSSNIVKVCPIAYMSELYVSCVSFAGDSNVYENLYEVEPDPETGNWKLYILGGTDTDKLKGQEDGYTQYVNLKFNNINPYALNMVTVEQESGILSNYNFLEYVLTIEAKQKGITQVLITAEDESGWYQLLNFEVVYLSPKSYNFASFSNNQIDLVCDVDGMSSVNLNLVSYAPSYSYIDLKITVNTISGDTPVIVDDTLILANTVGTCLVTVSLAEGEIYKQYTVTVYGKPNNIKVISQNSIEIQKGGTSCVIFELQDENGNLVPCLEFDIKVYNENNELVDEKQVYCEMLNGILVVQVYEQGIYNLKISTTIGQIISVNIPIVCY